MKIFFLGKSYPSSKAKKSKSKSGDPGEGSSGGRNPRMTSQSGNETDEDDLGQEIVKPDTNCAKFCSNSCSKISSIINTDKLIPHVMSDLRGDLEKLFFPRQKRRGQNTVLPGNCMMNSANTTM